MKHRSNDVMSKLLLGLVLCVVVGACNKEQEPETQPAIFSANGDINVKITEFRNQLGSLNNTTGMTTGRREINWDGVPDALNGLKLPGDFFNPTAAGSTESLQRGVVYGGFNDAMVSKSGFDEVNVEASSEFVAFSGNKNFGVVNASKWPVTFQVAGQSTAANIRAFGAVFVDVDKANSTFIEYFNGSTSLGRFFVEPHTAASSFSFLGVYFPEAIVTDVVISHEGKLNDGEKDFTQGGTKDLVVLDDFIYSEPLAR